jgi:hypothetical protein
LEALWTVIFDIFYDHLEYFVAVCFISWQFGICCGNLSCIVTICYSIPIFGSKKKSGNPA